MLTKSFRVSFSLLIAAVSVFAQKHPTVQVRKPAIFGVIEQLPKLQYECPKDAALITYKGWSNTLCQRL